MQKGVPKRSATQIGMLRQWPFGRLRSTSLAVRSRPSRKNSRTVAKAEELGESGWLGYARYGLGQAYFIAGRCREAEQYASACARLSQPAAAAPVGTTARSLLLLCCMMKGAAHAALGELVEAESFILRAQSMADETRRPYDGVVAGHATGILLMARGEWVQAEQKFRKTLELARKHDVNLFLPVLACQLGVAVLEQESVAQACQMLTQARTEAEAMGHTSAGLRAAVNLALAYGRSNDLEQKLRLPERPVKRRGNRVSRGWKRKPYSPKPVHWPPSRIQTSSASSSACAEARRSPVVSRLKQQLDRSNLLLQNVLARSDSPKERNFLDK